MDTNISQYHTPVMLQQVIEAMQINPAGTYIDCTLGGGGHFFEIAKQLGPNGTIVGIDRDADAIQYVEQKVADLNLSCRVILQKSHFSALCEIGNQQGLGEVNAILVDLGVSSWQLDTEDRGFSYRFNSPLDMRMDRTYPITAKDLLLCNSVEELATILSEYGEVHNSIRMAQAIKQYSQNNALETSQDLLKCLSQEYGGQLRPKILSKIFQALRIAVNHELQEISALLPQATQLLKLHGRLVVIAYHSLEDRIVKEFVKASRNSHDSSTTVILKQLHKKVIQATREQIESNSRSRSAKLRISEKVSIE